MRAGAPCSQVAIDAGGPVDRRDGGAGRTGPALERHARGDAGGNRSPGSWHNRCHQRAAGAQGSEVALLTTEGHRDVIEMREGLKPDRYDLRSPPPEPLVPRERRFGVRERLKASGEALIPLDAASLGDTIAAVRNSGATSVAVCFLHSYLNPAHELEAVERLVRSCQRSASPDPATCCRRSRSMSASRPRS